MYENRTFHKWENTDAPNTLIMSEEPEHGSVMKPLRWYLRTPGTIERMAYIWVYEYAGGPTHLYDQTKWCAHESEYQAELTEKLAQCGRFARNVARIEVVERDVETGALRREA